MKLNVPESNLPRIVIIGAGFAGLKVARKLNTDRFQVVLIDKNNYHQFQPLLYQVASSGVEASSISFPLRQIFQKHKNVHVRLASFNSVDTEKNVVFTSMGTLGYDRLIICTGIDTNYYGMQKVKDLSYSMKSVTEAVQVRNAILENFENALMSESEEEQNGLMSIAVIGGGPTGVELSGALAEMKRYILPKDYPELNFSQTKIYLVEASEKILGSFSESSIRLAKKYLKDLGVELLLNSSVKDYDGKRLFFSDGRSILIGTLIWAAGVKGNKIEGLSSDVYVQGGRIKTDDYNKIVGYDNIYAIGDIAFMQTDQYPKGHPQVAQVAIQQAKRLANNFNLMVKGFSPITFYYKDSGSMATVGRNKAVVQLPFLSFHGFLAWLVWAFVHLMAIVGVKNRLQIFINWAWSYVSYNKSFRLIYKFKSRNE
jgi:NADH:ubiquinone reductase (H+-translocating)